MPHTHTIRQMIKYPAKKFNDEKKNGMKEKKLFTKRIETESEF